MKPWMWFWLGCCLICLPLLHPATALSLGPFTPASLPYHGRRALHRGHHLQQHPQYAVNVTLPPQTSSPYTSAMTADAGNASTSITSCAGLTGLPAGAEACEFIREHCSGPEIVTGHFNYLKLVYCHLPAPALPLGTALLFLLLAVYFVAVSQVASDYFCPNVSTVSRILRLPPDVAGVTLVALGNAANDLVANLISFGSGQAASLAFGEILGAGLFLNCVVVGTIGWIGGGNVQFVGASVMRDIGFYLVGLMMVAGLVSSSWTEKWMGAILLLLYLVYVLVAIGCFRNVTRFRNWIPPAWSRWIWGMSGQSSEESILVSTSQETVLAGPSPLADLSASLAFDMDSTGSPAVQRDRKYTAPPIMLPAPALALSSPPLARPARVQQLSSANGMHRRSYSEIQMPVSSVALPIPKSNSDQGVNSYLDLHIASPRKRSPRLLRDYTPADDLIQEFNTWDRVALGGSSEQDQVSENIFNLHFSEAVLENMRVSSLSNALEIWAAYRHLRPADRGEHLSNPPQPSADHSYAPAEGGFVIPTITIKEPSSPIPSGPPSIHEQNNALNKSPSAAIGGESLGSTSSKSFLEPLGGPSLLTVPVERTITKTSVKTHRSRLSVVSHGELQSLHVVDEINSVGAFELADRCTVCFRGQGLDEATIGGFESRDDVNISIVRRVFGPGLGSLLSRIRRSVFISHFFPVSNTWTILGFGGRLLALINLVPVFVFSATVPVVASFDDLDADELAVVSSPSDDDFTAGGELDYPRDREKFEMSLTSADTAPRTLSDAPRTLRNRSPSPRPLPIDPEGSDHRPASGCRYGRCAWIPWRHRWLCVCQIFFSPFLIVYATSDWDTPIGDSGLLAWHLCVLIGTGRPYCLDKSCHYCIVRRPFRGWTGIFRALFTVEFWKYRSFYRYLSIMGFLCGLMWILLISSEVVAVLIALGKMLSLSDSILGMTILTFGNSVGDFATNTMIARIGFPSMAVGACWGAPMLNLLITMGIAIPVFWYQDHVLISFGLNPILLTSFLSLVLVLVSHLVLLGYVLKFRLTRLYSAYLVCIWVITISINVILEATGHSGAA